jgi:hypothetical protein
MKYFFFGFVAWRRKKFVIYVSICYFSRSRQQRGLRRESTASRWLELLVRIPPACMVISLLWVLCVVR